VKIEELVCESVARMEATAGGVPMAATMAATAEAVPMEGIKDLIAKLTENLQNVDPEEAAEILAQIETAVAAYATGNWIGGTIALVAALRMYRQAVKD
jgi:hypothetical protein